MRALVPEIAWHNKNPVFAVDIQLTANKGFYRAATAGGDSHVVIWHLVLNEVNEVQSNFAADLDRHIKSVNVVRFSRNSGLLASGDDDAIIIIWTLRDGQGCGNSSFTNDESNKENWVSIKTLRGHKDDIYDLCWSPFSNELLSGSVDNTAILWNVDKGTNTGTLGEHSGFVQGVAWDPKGKCLATLSSDRALRVFDADLRKMIAKVTKAKLNKPTANQDAEDNCIRLFHDDTVKTFFRRLTFSPDGILIFVPCGIFREGENEAKPPNDVTYIFLKVKPDRPILHLPSPDEYTVAVRCCPVLFELNPTNSNLFGLPYRIIFVIASRRSLVFYDTQQTSPFAFVTDIHYATLTDISWSHDGRLLLASSSDGYCTIVTFEEGELGVPYINNVTQSNTLDDSEIASMNVSSEYSFIDSVSSYSQVNQELSVPVDEIESKKKLSASNKYEAEALAVKDPKAEETPTDSSLLDVNTQNKDESKMEDSDVVFNDSSLMDVNTENKDEPKIQESDVPTDDSSLMDVNTENKDNSKIEESDVAPEDSSLMDVNTENEDESKIQESDNPINTIALRQ